MKLPHKKTSALVDFFTATEAPFGVAIVRILLPIAAGVPMLLRFPRVRQLFSTDGASSQLFELYGQGEVLPLLSPGIAVPLYGAMLLCLLFATIGFRTRLSLCVAAPLYLYFNFLDPVGTMTKYSVIAFHLLLLLAVSDAGLVWSVDAFLKRRKSATACTMPPRVSVWPARLMQLLFCYIYFGAAITKIQTTAFFSGDQMRYWMLSNWNYENPAGEWMAMWSPLLLIGGYMAVIWEVLFGFLVFQRRTRLVMLGLGMTFHFLTWLTLGLIVFPTICISAYFAFMMQDDVISIRKWLRRRHLGRLLQWPARAAERFVSGVPELLPAGVTWACLLGVTAIGVTELELWMDLYGVNRVEGAMALAPMDTTVARAMIRDEQRLREHDKYFSFDIGTLTIGDQLANRRHEFTYGQWMIAQCNLNPPHEDMWVECLLQDAEERTIEQFGQFVTRDMLRANFQYLIGNKLLPGDYQMVLKSANQEIYRRPFRLTGTPPAAPAADQLLTN